MKLAERMKLFYEYVARTKLMRRCPVAIRIDGKAFHTFTRKFDKPFDNILMESMQETMLYLCKNIQGCVLGYTQSDEITLILIDYQKLTSCAWFDYNLQKMCYISASMATLAFNRIFERKVREYVYNNGENFEKGSKEYKLCEAYKKAVKMGAMFDSRCFSIPKDEVTNLIYWRQIDASRNSIQMVGRAYFSHKELENKSSSEIQDMLMLKHGVNWNNFSIPQKRGSCAIKKEYLMDKDGKEVIHVTDENISDLRIKNKWIIDKNIPIFKGENRTYIDSLVK